MKHQLAIYVLFSLLATTSVFGQNGNIRLLMGENCEAFYEDGTMYVGDSSSYQYNSDNRLIEKNIWEWFDPVTSWEYFLQVYDFVYDSDGNLLSNIGKRIVNPDWNTYRTTNTYDVENHQLSKTVERLINNVWEYDNSTSWTYNANGDVLSETKFEGNSNTLSLYVYNAQGWLNTRTFQIKTNGNWVNSGKWTYSYSLQSGSKPSIVISQSWGGSSWVNQSKTTYTYDSNGNEIEDLAQNWNNNSVLINNWLTTSTYDANNNNIYWLFKQWENGAWVEKSRQFNEYDADSYLLSWKMDFLKPATGWYFANRCRYFYSDFVSTQSPSFADFNISPNPATTSIALKGADFAHIALFDLQGRCLHSQRLQGQPEEIQLGNLPSGNYLLQVIGSDGKMGAKPLQISH